MISDSQSLAPKDAWWATAALELRCQTVEAAADHGSSSGEVCSGMMLAVTTGPQDFPTEKSQIFVCVETV